MKTTLACLIFLSVGNAEEVRPEERKRQKLVSALTDVAKGSNSLVEEKEAQRKLLKAWSDAQIQALGKWEEWVNNTSLSNLVLQEWGERSKMNAVQHFVVAAKKDWRKYDRKQQSLSDPTLHEAFVENIGLSLEQVFIGWGLTDPKSAWAVIADREGSVAKLLDATGYGHRIPYWLFESLARIDPDFAVAEFGKNWNPHYQGSMLQGMAKGLPVGYDWKGLFETVLKTRGTKNRYALWPLRGSLLARWMQDDHKSAIQWSKSKVGRLVMFEEGEPVSLRYALRHWLSNDLVGATRWLKAHPEMIDGLLREGTWLDPDDLSHEALRQMLAKALPLNDREKLLTQLLEKGEIDCLFHPKVEWTKAVVEEIRTEIAQLEVGPKIATKLQEDQQIKAKSSAENSIIIEE